MRLERPRRYAGHLGLGSQDLGLAQARVRCFQPDLLLLPGVAIPRSHVKDPVDVEIKLDGDLEIPFDTNFTILTVVAPKAVEEIKKPEEETEEGAEPEKETEGSED